MKLLLKHLADGLYNGADYDGSPVTVDGVGQVEVTLLKARQLIADYPGDWAITDDGHDDDRLTAAETILTNLHGMDGMQLRSIGAIATRHLRPPEEIDGTSIIMLANVTTVQQKGCTEEAVRRVLEYTPRPFELLLVDNGSTQSMTWALGLRDVRVIRHTTNVGCIVSRNAAARAAKYDLLAFLDNDQHVGEGWLRSLKDTMAREKCTCVGVEHWTFGDDGTPVRGSQWSDRSYVGIGGVLFRREAWEAVGGLSEEFSPAYGEDPDVCWKLVEAGFKVSHCPGARIEHVGGGHMTLGTDNPLAKEHDELLRRKWPWKVKPKAEEAALPLGVELSVVLSIYNRSDLFRAGLASIASQSLSPERFEVVIVDDESTEDLREVYGEYIGKLNIVHVRMNHRRHWLWPELNPKPKKQETWFHTPALSINLGLKRARGEVVCITQPEVVLAPDALEEGLKHGRTRAFVFGDICLSTAEFRNHYLESGGAWADEWQTAIRDGHRFVPNEMYWFLSFLRREIAVRVGGVDEEYLRGVYGEDDDFRDRVRLSGVPLVRNDSIRGIHLDHSDEKHWKQQRASAHWREAGERNRARYRAAQALGKSRPWRTNTGKDWGSDRCVAEVHEWRI